MDAPVGVLARTPAVSDDHRGGVRRAAPRARRWSRPGNYGEALAKHPTDLARFHRVIEKVTELAGWDAAKRAGRALGLAAHRSFLSYVAVVAQVSKGARGEIRVDEAWVVADCGMVVNADRVRSQLEGAFVFGQSAMMHGAITMKGGGSDQG